jgi:hypothetical protein
MNSRALAIVALILSILRVLVFILSLGVLFFSNVLNDSFGNAMHFANSALHIVVLLLIAVLLNFAKENIWTTIAYILNAFISGAFVMMGNARVTDPKIWGAVSFVNIFVIVFFTIRSFLVTNAILSGAMKAYAVILLIMMAMSMALPYIATLLYWPMANIRFFSVMYIIPAVVEVYLASLFYQYFNSVEKPAYHNFNNGL